MRKYFAILIVSAMYLPDSAATHPGNGHFPLAATHPHGSVQHEVEQRFWKMSDFATAGMRDSLHSFLVYRGEDNSRRWKDVWDDNQPEERQEADRAARELVSLFQNLKKISVMKYESETESEGEWHVLTVRMKYASGKPKEMYFAFLMVKGEYCLGDVDD